MSTVLNEAMVASGLVVVLWQPIGVIRLAVFDSTCILIFV